MLVPWGQISQYSTWDNLGTGGTHQSKESDFVIIADSTEGHLPLSPMVFSCCVAYQLERTSEFPLLQGFWQSLALVSPLCSTLHLGALDCIMWGRLDIPTVFHPGSSNCIFPSKFHTIIFLLPVMFRLMSKPFILCHILTKEDFWCRVFGSWREHKNDVGRELSRYLPLKWFFSYTISFYLAHFSAERNQTLQTVSVVVL